MDAYFMKDSKTAASKLDSDLDSYFAKRGEKKDDEEPAAAETAEAPGEPVAVEES